jgi:hypothetical protein
MSEYYMPDKDLIKSYVWHNDRCFFVSTIDRESSCIDGGRFSETMVWEYNWNTQTRATNIYHQDEDSSERISRHIRVCQILFETGKVSYGDN